MKEEIKSEPSPNDMNGISGLNDMSSDSHITTPMANGMNGLSKI
jgi:hypothetical protein